MEYVALLPTMSVYFGLVGQFGVHFIKLSFLLILRKN